MKKIILSILLSIPLLAMGQTTYYVKNGGSDAAAGTSDALAWETIGKVNGETFSAGDSILFKRGDVWLGRVLKPPSSGSDGNPIIFGAYSTGPDPVITPNDTISGISWSVHPRNDSIYYTTDITFNPGNFLIGTDIGSCAKVQKIHDDYFSSSTVSPGYGLPANMNSLDFLDLPYDQRVTSYSVSSDFWANDSVLACYNDDGNDSTYVRFRYGADPNDYNFFVSGEDSSAIEIRSANYVTIRDLRLIGGEYGIWLYTSSDCVIDSDSIESSHKHIYNQGSSTDRTEVSNNEIFSVHSGANPGAWSNFTLEADAPKYYKYDFAKFVIDNGSSSGNADGAFLTASGPHEDFSIHDNTITNVILGVNAIGSNSMVYNNTMSGLSSIGAYVANTSDESHVYNNSFSDCNIPFRCGSIDASGSRTFYFYRNTIYNPDLGQAIYLHYNGANPSTSTIYIYHNSFICKEGIQISGYGDNDKTGLVFVNNIMSASTWATYGWSDMYSDDTLMVWDYNWVSGTYHTYSTSVWSPVPDNYKSVSTFWDHDVDPPDFTNIMGSEAIDAGVDVSSSFSLWSGSYPALPDSTVTAYVGTADMGYYELPIVVNQDIVLIDTSLAISFDGDTVFTILMKDDSMYVGAFDNGQEKWWSKEATGSDNATIHTWKYTFTTIASDSGLQVGQITVIDSVRVVSDKFTWYSGGYTYEMTNLTASPLAFDWSAWLLIAGVFLNRRNRRKLKLKNNA